jgi:hypothetical protein
MRMLARVSECNESVGERGPEMAVIAVELSTIRKGKRKVAPARAKVFSEVHGLVSYPAKVIVNMQLILNAHSATSVSCGR